MKRLLVLFTLIFGMQVLNAAAVGVAPKISTSIENLEALEPVPIRNLVVTLMHSHLTIFQHDFATIQLQEALNASFPIMTTHQLTMQAIGQYEIFTDLLNSQLTISHIAQKYGLDSSDNITTLTQARTALPSLQQDLKTGKLSEANEYLYDIYYALVTYTVLKKKINDWEVYMTDNDNIIFLPKDSVQANAFTIEKNWKKIDLKTIDYAEFATLSNPKNATETKIQQSVQFLKDFKTLTTTSDNLPLNVRLVGHGVPESQFLADRNIGSVVAGLDRDTFKKLTKYLANPKVNTQSFFYSTCFGGGSNIAYIFEEELPYLVIAQGIGDATVTSVAYQNLDSTNLSEYFASINSNVTQALQTINLKDTGKGTQATSEFQVRLPGTQWFSLAQINVKLKNLSKIKTMAAHVNGQTITLDPTKIYTLSTDTVLAPLILTEAISEDLEDGSLSIKTLYPFEKDGGTFYLKEIQTAPGRNVSEALEDVFSLFTEDSYKVIFKNFYIEQVTVSTKVKPKLLTNVIVSQTNGIIWTNNDSGETYFRENSGIMALNKNKQTIGSSGDSIELKEGTDTIGTIKAKALAKRDLALKEAQKWKALKKVLPQAQKKNEFNFLKNKLDTINKMTVNTEEERINKYVELMTLSEIAQGMSLTDEQTEAFHKLFKASMIQFNIEALKMRINHASSEKEIQKLQANLIFYFTPDQVAEQAEIQQLIDSKKQQIKVTNHIHTNARKSPSPIPNPDPYDGEEYGINLLGME